MSLLSSLFIWFLTITGNVELVDCDQEQASQSEACHEGQRIVYGTRFDQQPTSTNISNGF